jgi:mercuric ion transport protein
VGRLAIRGGLPYIAAMDRIAERTTTAGGVALAALAVAASSCCALPLALVLMGVSSTTIGLLGPLHAARPVILAVSVLLIGAGWYFAVRRRSARAYVPLTLATLLLALALAWQLWEPEAMRLLASVRA